MVRNTTGIGPNKTAVGRVESSAEPDATPATDHGMHRFFRRRGDWMANNAFTELQSPRLILRRLLPDDLTALFAYRSLAEAALYQDWESFGPDDAVRL